MLISLRWIGGIVKKDWQQHVSTIVILLAGTFVPLFAPGDELKQEMMSGVVLAAAYAYANYIFTTERTCRTLPLLLGLPVRPVPLILGKFVSLYSMCLLTVNLPGIFLIDPHALYLMNGLLIGLGAICMASTVLWDSQMAPLAPVLLVGLTFHWVAYKDIKPYEFQLATAGLILAPIIAITSAFLFKRQVAVK